jgi:hypothetical protein
MNVKALEVRIHFSAFSQESLAFRDVSGADVNHGCMVKHVGIGQPSLQRALARVERRGGVAGFVERPREGIVGGPGLASLEILSRPLHGLRAVFLRVGEETGEVMDVEISPRSIEAM